jgi:raffinose/stachyose/melibiose transport system substrate-binding protein
MYQYDGNTYGVPYLLQCTFLFYNKRLFAEKGWQPPNTWPELLTLCKRIRAAGIIPIALGNLQKWPAHHFPCVLAQRLMGADAVERQYDPTGPGVYDDPGWAKSLDMFMQLADLGAFPKSPNGVDRSAARVLFYSGKAAMFYTGTWDLARLSKGGEAPETFWDSWDFVNFPSVPGGKGEQDCLAGSPDGYVVSSRSPNLAAAVRFLQFMTSVEQAKSFVSKCQELVQVRGAVTEGNAGRHLAKYMRMVEAAPRLSAWADTMMEESVAQAYMGGVQELLGGTATPQQVMERVRQRQTEVRRDLEAKQQAGK